MGSRGDALNGGQTAAIWPDMTQQSQDYIDMIVAEPPGPQSEFIDVVNSSGRSFRAGTWHELPDGTWALRIRFRGEIVTPPLDEEEEERPGFV